MGGPKPCVDVGLSQKLKKGQLYKGVLGEIKIGHVTILSVRLSNGWDP